MSKIYEALLRAELERSETNGHKKVPSTPEPAPFLAPVQAAPLPVPVAAPEVKVVPPPVMVPPPALGNFDPSRIPIQAWEPSLKQLPSLLERGTAVEQFRSLRSRMHEFRDLNPLKSIVISSGLPQDGKSFIAANLAISFARHKASRVLLIDGDMRRSSLHQMLGCPSEPGLTEYLSGKCGPEEVMQQAAPRADGTPLQKGIASLTVIAGGSDAENAADLSGSSRFGDLIRLVSPYFDWIVVDTPPVNLVTDGVNLCRSCDGALLIARGGVTKYEAAQRALAELKSANVLGIVLNAVLKPQTSEGYYGYDGYDGYDRPKT